jgi:hypothetical protein
MDTSQQSSPVGKMTRAEYEALFEKRIAGAKDLAQASFGHASTYFSVVIIGGYGAAFALWNFTKEILEPWLIVTCGLLLCVSVISFVGFEIFKMVLVTINTRSQAEMANSLNTDDLDAARNKAVKSAVTLNKWNYFVWRVALVVCTLTAAGAGILLICNFAYRLVTGWYTPLDYCSRCYS